MGGEIISESGGGIIPLQGGAIIPELGGGFLRNQHILPYCSLFVLSVKEKHGRGRVGQGVQDP